LFFPLQNHFSKNSKKIISPKFPQNSFLQRHCPNRADLYAVAAARALFFVNFNARVKKLYCLRRADYGASCAVTAFFPVVYCGHFQKPLRKANLNNLKKGFKVLLFGEKITGETQCALQFQER